MPRSRALIVSGAVVMAVGVVVGVVSAALLVSSLVRGVADALSGPSYPTPGRVVVHAERTGRYVVYEMTGRSPDESGGFGETEPTITPDMVSVTGPDGATVAVEQASGFQLLTRGCCVYTGAVQFAVVRSGDYTIDVAQPGTRVVVAPSLGSAVRGSTGWGAGVGIAVLMVAVGLVLLVVGLVQRGRDRRAAPALAASGPYSTPVAYAPAVAGPYAPPVPAPAPTPPGWYADPYRQANLRYWDGASWTPYTG